MTLATVPRYDGSRPIEGGERAVVVGAGMAGLLAARVVADAFEAVTVLERDHPPAGPVARRGVPQGRHVHVMLEAGRATLEALFPGFRAALRSDGGLEIDGARDVNFYAEGDFLADGPTRLPQYAASRPLYEHLVRRRIADRDGVRLRPGCQFTDYLVDEGNAAVEGVAFRNEAGAEAELAADLVVDATGRASRTPDWLERQGFRAPPVDEVSIDLAYSTVILERSPADRRAYLVAPEPPRTRGFGMFPVESDRWIATLGGIHGDHPPTDPADLRAYAAKIPGLDVPALLEAHPWASDEVAHYPFPSNRRRRYEALERLPEGLVVLGDAVASFNPLYGQGMSVAALEALLLHHCLATVGLDGLPARFFERCGEVVDVAWALAVGSDYRFPQTTGPRPRAAGLVNRYLARLHRRAHSDGRLREAFTRVVMMERPPFTLFHPRVAWRVLRPTR